MTKVTDNDSVPPMLDDFERPRPPPLSSEKRIRPGLGLAIFVGLFGCFSLLGIVWYSFNQGSLIGLNDDVPLVKAESSAMRIRPENPGGLEVPNKDKLVLKNLTSSSHSTSVKTEKLIARPEIPINFSETKIKTTAKMKIDPRSKQRSTTKIKKSGTDNVLPSSKVAVLKNKSSSDVRLNNKKTRSDRALREKVVSKNEKKSEIQSPKLIGSYRVQIVSLRNEAAAREFWKSVQSKYSKTLSKMQGRIQRITIQNKGTFFRVQGDVVSKGRASEICEILKKRKQACIVIAE